MTTPTSTQEVVHRLDDETMQRLIVGVADHLQYAATSKAVAQQHRFNCYLNELCSTGLKW